MNNGRKKLLDLFNSTDTIAALFTAWLLTGGIMLFTKGKQPLSLTMFEGMSIVKFGCALVAFFFAVILLKAIFSKAPVVQIALLASTVIFIPSVLIKDYSYFMIFAMSLLTFLVMWYLSHSSKLFKASPPITVKVFMLCLLTVPIAFTARYLSQTKIASYSVFITVAVLSVAIIALLCLIFKSGKIRIALPSRAVKIIIVSVFALTAAFIVGYIVTVRYISYSTYSFDFGIFTNMYHHMKTEFLPYVSCERDKLLSHFAVHFSPALYLILPAYLIFPSPITIQIAQVVILYSGIVPLMLLMKKYKLDSLTSLFIGIVYSAYPIFGTGCLYDFHENCFLLPFLLWMFCLYEYDKTILTFAAALLVLSVKEDAFIYILIFGAYLIFSRKDYKKSFALIALAVICFAAAYIYLSKNGEGIMAYRYANLTGKGESLFKVIPTVLTNPGYFFSQLFSTSSSDFGKIKYFAVLMLPLVFLPFMSKKFSRFILLVPILMNLMTMYKYQYDVSFQYSFGISAFLLYCTVINLAEQKESTRHVLSSAAAIVSMLMFFIMVIPQFTFNMKKYSENADNYKQLDSILDEIPDDASVTAARCFVVKLTNRDEIYDLHYHKDNNLTDYIILDMRESQKEVSLNLFEKYSDDGYVLVSHHEGMADIYRKAE